MARMSCPRGTDDLLPEALPALDHVFGSFQAVMDRFGYREIRTPLFEETALFVRSLGDESDVVEKEMFTVRRGDTDVTFRPEGTAPVVRAYLQHNLDKSRAFQKFWYGGPMFRFERPQAGRSRQFYQVGVEALGSTSPLLDTEVVLLAHRAFERMGLKNYRVHLNSIGDPQDRAAFRAVLKAYFEPLLSQRCEDCQRRFQRNVFRMLDCKVPQCQPTNRAAPQFLDHLRPESRARFDESLQMLRALDVPCEVDPGIVRGFDYYTHLVFEVRCPDLGARDAVCGGGRYDGLIAAMGGPDLGAVGFAIGVTPTLLALEKQGHPAVAPRERSVPVFVAPLGDAQRAAAFRLTQQLRDAGLTADTDFEQKSLKAQFKGADKRGAEVVLVLGPDELQSGSVQVRALRQGRDLSLPMDDGLPDRVRELLQPADDAR
ncbi:MAG: histidine--tRNA ligase [Planctomycetota bacterium]